MLNLAAQTRHVLEMLLKHSREFSASGDLHGRFFSRARASSRSRVSRATSFSSATGDGLESISTFAALRRVGFAGLGRRRLIGSPPALERLFIASPYAEGHRSRSKVHAGSGLFVFSDRPL